jgi:hypothetical protein
MTITLTREEAQHLLEVFELFLEEAEDVTTLENNLIKMLRTRLAQPEPEPVAVWELQEDGWDTIADPDWMESLPVGTKLYTAPPQREWQGLTDEEHMKLAEEWGCLSADWVLYAAAIERKIKEKNT